MAKPPIEPVTSDLAPTQKGWGPRVDGHKVIFWALKRDAIAAAKAISWTAGDVTPVHTRFCGGYAIAHLGGWIGRETYAELVADSQRS